MMLASAILHTGLHALGWMLVHSLWQGIVLALLAAFIISLTGRRASFHYQVLLLAFVVFITACVCTFCGYAGYGFNYGMPATNVLPGVNTYMAQQQQRALTISSLATFIPVFAPWLVCCWFPFCCYRLVKSLRGYQQVHRLSSGSVTAVSPEWSGYFTKLTQLMRVTKKVRLLECKLVGAPVSIGFWKPVVLIPLGMLCALPPAQVEVILRHELAHIRRNDYLVNLFQLVAEAVFFFNPGLLWLSRQLREKREYCCDDDALADTYNKTHYVQALVYFSSLALTKNAMAMELRGQPGQLYRRVTRILGGGAPVKPVWGMILLYIGVLAFFIFTGVYITTHKQPVHRVIPAVSKVPVAMDSVMLGMLTGEFSTTYNNAHYIIGVAQSRITHLTINGQAIPSQQWHYYNNAFAAAVLEFKTHLEKAKPTFPSSSRQPVHNSATVQARL